MAGWEPGNNPFPDGEIDRISEFEYLDELKFVRHAQVHAKRPPQSLWQLSADFRVRMRVHPEDGNPYKLTIKAPHGLYTDLASVPKAFWMIVGPIGPHLEVSIVHDYLYMAWTDFHPKARRSDWNFADAIFLAGLKASNVKERNLIHAAVRLAGWPIFRTKSYTLKNRMNVWLKHLQLGHGRAG